MLILLWNRRTPQPKANPTQEKLGQKWHLGHFFPQQIIVCGLGLVLYMIKTKRSSTQSNSAQTPYCDQSFDWSISLIHQMIGWSANRLFRHLIEWLVDYSIMALTHWLLAHLIDPSIQSPATTQGGATPVNSQHYNGVLSPAVAAATTGDHLERSTHSHKKDTTGQGEEGQRGRRRTDWQTRFQIQN